MTKKLFENLHLLIKQLLLQMCIRDRPSACLNGMFSLKAGRGRTSIRVEDYKRPTFDITFEKQQGS